MSRMHELFHLSIMHIRWRGDDAAWVLGKGVYTRNRGVAIMWRGGIR